KVVTSGEGGMLVTDDDEFADRVHLLRNYGKRQPWVTISDRMGFNWRLNELAAAVGITQLKRLDSFISWRERVAARYSSGLSGVPEARTVRPFGRSSWYKYII